MAKKQKITDPSCPSAWIDIERDFKKKYGKMDPYSCAKCGKKLVPAIDQKNFVTGEWDGYSYRCPCWKNKLILSIG